MPGCQRKEAQKHTNCKENYKDEATRLGAFVASGLLRSVERFKARVAYHGRDKSKDLGKVNDMGGEDAPSGPRDTVLVSTIAVSTGGLMGQRASVHSNEQAEAC